MDVFGVICRVLSYSSLIVGALNTIKVEFTTPYYVDPNGILLCVANEDAILKRSNFTILSVEEGGSQFEAGTNVYTYQGEGVDASLREAPFFSPASSAWRHRAVELGSVQDVLATDPYYAHTYTHSRYDDLKRDGQGRSLAGVVVDIWQRLRTARERVTEILDRVAAEEEELGDEEVLAVMDQLKEAGRPEGNCALLTATWKAGTRYQVEFSFINPNATDGTIASELAGVEGSGDEGGAVNDGTLGVWMAPITYSWLNDDEETVLYSLRGHKHGQMCPAKDGVSNELIRTCPDQGTCPGSPSAVNSSSCPDGTLFGQHSVGGECVECNGGEIAVSTAGGEEDRCSCSSGSLPAPVGPAACGPVRGLPDRPADTPAQLAHQLCSLFTSHLANLHQGELSDLLVGKTYLDLFLGYAPSLVDEALVRAGNETFRNTLLFDERRPDDPTRMTGLKGPGCMHCKDTTPGMFTDYSTGFKNAEVKDLRFDSVQTFRFIGYLLHQSGHDCTDLYDPDNPFTRVYGKYNEFICDAL